MTKTLQSIILSIGLMISFSCNTTQEISTKNSLMPIPASGTLYGTWLNVWFSSSESWWKSDNYYGQTTIMPNNTWSAPDWNNAEWRKMVYIDLKNAGINFIVTDNTNGLYNKSDLVFDDINTQNIDLNYCVAFSSRELSSATDMDWLLNRMKDNKYLRIDGKPVLVCYVTKSDWITKFQKLTNLYADNVTKLSQFYRVWASGENSGAEKWGWQLEPQDGLISSKVGSFVTNSVNHEEVTSVSTTSYWSMSSAIGDYTFWQARMNPSNYVIVGSYDDLSERNGWMPMQTVAAMSDGNKKFNPTTGIQLFNTKTGKPDDPYFLRNRTENWIKGKSLTLVSGGNIPDGIYSICNVSHSKYISANTNIKQKEIMLADDNSQTHNKFVIYHVGNNQYRIVNVFSGFPLMSKSEIISADVWTGTNSELFEFQDSNEKTEHDWILIPIGTFEQNAQSKTVKIKSTESKKLLKVGNSNIVLD